MRRIRNLCMIAAVLLVASCTAKDTTVEHINHAKAGQPILRAVYQFKQDTGTYPTNLLSLVPKYLNTAPIENWNTGWYYGPADYRGITNGFKLSRFSVGYKTRIQYIDDGSSADWVVNEEGTRTKLNLSDPREPSNKPSEATSQ